MSALAGDLATRMRVADPKPDYCSVCFRGAQEGVEFIDCGAAHEGPTIVAENGAVIGSIDDINLCFTRDDNGRVNGGCAKELCEVLGLKPELHTRQLKAIGLQEIRSDHWHDACKRAEAERDKWIEYAERLEAEIPKAPRPPGRPRKQ